MEYGLALWGDRGAQHEWSRLFNVLRKSFFPCLVLGSSVGCSKATPNDTSSGRHCRHVAIDGSTDAGRSAGIDGGDSGTAAHHGTCEAEGGVAASPIALENAMPGSTAWRITTPATSHEIEGYADTTSATAGDVVSLMVSASSAKAARWELYRLGYYGGSGARLVESGGPAAVAHQADCPPAPGTGLVECAWTPSFTVDVAPTWLTGQYLFKLIREDGFESYVPLVVREPAPRAPIVFQSSVTTWQAYNVWGGTSLYDDEAPPASAFGGGAAERVSFDRPYEYARPRREGQPETEIGAGHLFLAELWMLRWLEQKGYDVAYLTNIDVDRSPDLLTSRKLMLDVGHDEYWSFDERCAVDGARDRGVSLGFFSGNSAFWRIRLDASSSGSPRRIVTCYKDAATDPEHDAPDTTVQWRYAPHSDPESRLIGQMYEGWTNLDAFPLVVQDPSHWIYEGTGVAVGDALSHVVGYEWDRVNAGPPPTLEVAARSPVFDSAGQAGQADVTVYYPSPSSFVFSAGTIEWSWGLGKPGYSDDRVARITENVLARAGQCPDAFTEVAPSTPPTDVGNAAEVSLVAGSGIEGFVDGTAAQAEFDSPVGVAADSSGTIYVTEALNHRIRRITPDGTVSTLAGCGPDGQMSGSFKDGQGTSACFNVPTGIVAKTDGTLYVSDTKNRRIRAVTPDGTVTTYAGDGTNQRRDEANPLRAAFSGPRGLALGADGALYVADYRALRRVGKDGVTTLASGTELSAVAVAPDGTVYAVSTYGGDVLVLKDGALVPIVNLTGTFGDQTGPGASALLRPADGLVVDGDALVLSDSANYKIRRISLTPDHTVTTLVGSGLFGSTLGTGATARVVNPRGLALDSSGILVADSGNHRILRIVR